MYQVKDVWYLILQYLEVREVLNTGKTCWWLYNVTCDETLWHYYTDRDYIVYIQKTALEADPKPDLWFDLYVGIYKTRINSVPELIQLTFRHWTTNNQWIVNNMFSKKFYHWLINNRQFMWQSIIYNCHIYPEYPDMVSITR